MKEFLEKLREKADTFEKSGCAVDGIVKDYRKSADMIEKLCGKSNICGFVEKLIKRLEDKAENNAEMGYMTVYDVTKECIQIVNQLAEEYTHSKSKSLEKQPEEPQTNFYAERFNRVI